MSTYLVKRVALTLPTLLGVSILIFSLIRLVPGDVVTRMLADAPTVDGQTEAALRAQLGLDTPFVPAYLGWLGGVLHGDLGQSLWTGRSVGETLLAKIPVSLELAALAMALTIVLGIPAGVVAAVKPGSLPDVVARFFTVGALSMPDFWIGTLLIVIPAIIWGYAPPVTFVHFWEDPARNLQMMLFPALALGLRYSASVMRFTRAGLLEVIQQDFVRTARAKGLSERVVLFRHALRNAFIPVVTLLGTQFGRLLGGVVIIETLFVLPGVGRSTVDAVVYRDYPQLQANVLFLAIVFVAANLVVDFAYAWLDPRIRFR